MKQYLLSVHYVDGQEPPPPDVMQEIEANVDALNQEFEEKGAWVFGGGLHTPDTATVVHAEAGGTLVTDGPFPEAKEQIGGFWIIRAADLDEALAWADKASRACAGPVEVRPFKEEVED